MASVSTWERFERQKLRRRERRTRHYRPGDRPDPSRPAGTDMLPQMTGFVTSTEQAAPEGDKTAAMAYWTEEDQPFYHGLARTFPLAGHWSARASGRVAHPLALRSLLKVLFPGYVRHAEQLVAGPDAYDTYGFRVPAVIVSPYARPWPGAPGKPADRMRRIRR